MTTIPQKEIQYKNKINSLLINQKIEEIFYEEINYELDREFWEYSDKVHSIDMNIIFKFENGKLIQIKWDNEFDCYGIGFEEISEIPQKEGFKVINVTNNINWKSKIGKNISQVNILWDETESQQYETFMNIVIPKGKRKIKKVPLTWNLKIASEDVYISAFEIKENSQNYYWADHLTVFFDKENIEKYNLKNACR